MLQLIAKDSNNYFAPYIVTANEVNGQWWIEYWDVKKQDYFKLKPLMTNQEIQDEIQVLSVDKEKNKEKISTLRYFLNCQGYKRVTKDYISENFEIIEKQKQTKKC